MRHIPPKEGFSNVSVQAFGSLSRESTYRVLSDAEILTLLDSGPLATWRIAKIAHRPGQAVDWYALKRSLHRLAEEGKVRARGKHGGIVWGLVR